MIPIVTINHAVPIEPAPGPRCRRCGCRDVVTTQARTPGGRVARLRCRACGLERIISRDESESKS